MNVIAWMFVSPTWHCLVGVVRDYVVPLRCVDRSHDCGGLVLRAEGGYAGQAQTVALDDLDSKL